MFSTTQLNEIQNTYREKQNEKTAETASTEAHNDVAFPHLFSFISGDFHPTAPIKSKSEHRDKPAIVHLIVKFMFVQIKSVARVRYLAATKVSNQV